LALSDQRSAISQTGVGSQWRVWLNADR